MGVNQMTTRRSPDRTSTSSVLGSLPDRLWVRFRDRYVLQRRLRISLVDRCNLSCFFCHNEGQGPIKRTSKVRLSIAELAKLVRVATREGVDSVKLTGGEPTLYASDEGDIVSLVNAINQLRITEGATFDLSMTTNGTMLPELAEPLAAAGLDRATVSLTTLDWRTFSELISPTLC